ncbi:17-beta-hydroxysteroid dehydrogenase [Penicillium chrysogenum]|uniref:17-beta-hydroxysteroid dehydrogenase n=1 Tax=Penicillium chrysogenum TaxID=5076 RepID=A0ABQ8WQ29_PENCH|nr:17-beta-hydroxysteroid dehydrogenase [Penicillium chrysogenum]KAJ5245025.1 17-beta-hydroxysteroid dehydrogenase [Penicillium chrysogenum]KAJ5274874.1 17-beta-hydroxysteroid dehydrogenase [Penicillium chrysogenum]KAJ6156597.1 17-beta-hydroxysteroid dehydrogenase [Penicillium chrysogenum]
MGSVSYIPYRLDGKVALVTGSGRGIGAAMAVELGRCGAKVIVNYSKSAGPANQVVDEIKALGSDAVALQADVSQVPQTVELFERAVKVFGGIDIVCSNAGVVSFGHLSEVTEEEFDRVFNVNTRGQFFVAREAYKHLNQNGRIILMSSNTADSFTVPKHSLYSASKGAINTFVRCLAKDCGDKKITVNAVAPGGTVTDMFHETAKDYLPNADKMSKEQILDIVAHVSPLTRCGYPIDIAKVVCFLASNESEWVNGKVLGIDGGAA